jgi:hypothetical protein
LIIPCVTCRCCKELTLRIRRVFSQH